MLAKLFDSVYDILSSDVTLSFGIEAASVLAYTILVILLRTLLTTLKVSAWVPNVLLFSNPFVLQYFVRGSWSFLYASSSPSLSSSSMSSPPLPSSSSTGGGDNRNNGRKHHTSSNDDQGRSSALLPSSASTSFHVAPHLPIRIAESLLGRSPSLLILIPSHLIGSIMGCVVSKLLLLSFVDRLTPYAAEALLPIIYGVSSSSATEGVGGGVTEGLLLGWQTFLKEIFLSTVFVLGFLVLPEIFRVNHKPPHYAFYCLVPLMFFKLPDLGPAFAPATLQASWYCSRSEVLEKYNVTSIQYEHVFGPVLGGVLAGTLMVFLFPDD